MRVSMAERGLRDLAAYLTVRVYFVYDRRRRCAPLTLAVAHYETLTALFLEDCWAALAMYDGGIACDDCGPITNADRGHVKVLHPPL